MPTRNGRPPKCTGFAPTVGSRRTSTMPPMSGKYKVKPKGPCPTCGGQLSPTVAFRLIAVRYCDTCRKQQEE